MNLYDQFIHWAGSLNAQQVADWLRHLEWNRLVPEITGKFIGFLLGFGASWFLLFRRHLRALDRLRRGDSDDVLFQAHFLAQVPGTDKYVLLFRNLMPSTTVNDLYDNPAARKIVRELADITTLRKPVLRTEGVHGYEVLNDAFNHISGHLAITPFPRETWLFAMTCEDRQVVRRKCVRCFLVRPAELERFANWRWCRDNVVCEQPWHWYRIVALHQLATVWQEEEKAAQHPSPKTQGMPLVDKHATHRRIRPMSVGIFVNEKPVGTPAEIHWPAQEWELKKLGLDLNAEPVPGV